MNNRSNDSFLQITREPMRVNVKNLIFEKVEKKLVDGSYTKLVSCKLHETEYAKGNFPIYIISNPSWNIHSGNDQEIYLKNATEGKIENILGDEYYMSTEQSIIVKKIAKSQKMNMKDKDENPRKPLDLLDDLLHKHSIDPVFFTPTLPISREELLKLPDLDSIIRQGLYGGMEKDERLVEITRASIPVPVNNISVIHPRQVMRSNPHGIIITSTKTGKTATMRKMSNVLERPTPSNLLGFSTAQDTVRGRLDGETRPFTIDGIEETEDERMAMGMLSYMESGIVEIARGKGVKTRGCSILFFLSNPSVETASGDDEDWFDDARNNLMQIDRLFQTLHQNQLGFGSRIGPFIFDPDMKPATGEGYSYIIEESYDKLIYSVQEATRYSFTQLLLNMEVDQWINNVSESIIEYNKKLGELLKEKDIRGYRLIHDFIKGHMSAFRHIRGMALRMSYMNHLQQMLEIEERETISDSLICEILDDAERNMDSIIGYNLESFSNLSNILQKEDARKTIYQGRYKNIESRGTKYELFLLAACARWYIEQPETDKTISVPLPQLKDYYLLISKEERDKSDYNTFNKFASAIENNPRKINGHKTWTGLSLNNVDNIILVTFTENKEWFKWIAEKKDLYTSGTRLQTPQIPHDEINKMGGMGEKGVGNKILTGNDLSDTRVISGFETIKKNHGEWAYTFIKSHHGMSKEAFVKEFLREWGQGFRTDEIEKLYDTITKKYYLTEKNKLKKGDR